MSMDPVSAMGLASSIITFLDFSWNLVKGSIEIYRSESGASTGLMQIGTVVHDLENVTSTLQTEVKSDSPHYDSMKKLTRDCTAVSAELSDLLKDLKRKEGDKIWRSIEAKWNRMRKEKEVASIEQRLSSLRLQLLLRLNIIISEEQSSVKLKLAEIEKTGLHFSSGRAHDLNDIQQAIQRLEKELVDEISETLRKSESEQVNSLAEIHAVLLALDSKLDRLPKTTSVEDSVLERLYFSSIYARVESIVDAEFGTFEWLLKAECEADAEVESTIDDEVRAPGAAHGPTDSDSASNIQPENDGQSHRTVEAPEQKLIVSKVKNQNEADSTLEEDNDRREPQSTEESKPEDEPYISRDPGEDHEAEVRRNTRQLFLTWLETGNQVYHVSGKAGSGKSTLMKFLCQHSRLKDGLEKWAGGKKLVLSSFFFWNSGENEQKTLEGLYRSLLFEILRQCPGLIREAFPGYYTRANIDALNFEGMPFRFSELRQAMTVVLGKRTFPDHCFCFFIDGLDEFEADLHTAHWELAQGLRNWATSPDVKICVSSRPHEEFLQCFDPKLRMHLHELTRSDVRHYVHGVLERYPNYARQIGDFHGTVSSVVDRADGVFLWVRLVVQSLIDGMRHRYPPEALKRKVDELPRGLGPMFDQLFNSIDPSDRERSDKMLLLAAFGGAQNALIYSWIDELADPDFPYSEPIRTYSDEEVQSRHEVVRCQIDGLSKGLLEMRPQFGPNSPIDPRYPMVTEDTYFQQNVDFFHRTVRDYLNDPERQVIIRKRLGEEFNVVSATQRLRLAEFKFARTMASYFKHQGINQTSLVSSFDSLFVSKGFGHTSKFLEECGKVLEHHRRAPFTYPDELKENSGTMAWSQGWDVRAGNFLTGDNLSYIQWLAGLHFRNDEYVVSRLLTNHNSSITQDGASVLFTASFYMRVSLVHKLLKAGVPPHGEVNVKYRDTSTNGLPSHVLSVRSPQVTTAWAAFLFVIATRLIENSSLPEVMTIPNIFLTVEEFLNFDADCNASFLLENIQPTSIEADGTDHSEGGEDVVSVSLEDFILCCRPPNLDVLMKHVLRRKGFWLWQGTKQVAAMALSSWKRNAQGTQVEYRRAQIGSLESMAERYRVKAVVVGDHKFERDFGVSLF